MVFLREGGKGGIKVPRDLPRSHVRLGAVCPFAGERRSKVSCSGVLRAYPWEPLKGRGAPGTNRPAELQESRGEDRTAKEPTSCM